MDLSFWINEYTQNTNSKVRAGKFINFGTFTMPRGGTTPPSSGKWPIYWLQPWHLLLSQSIKHCRLASLDLSWAQQGSPARLTVGREPWNQSYWNESWNGAHPQPIHRNLGAAGCQPGACLHVSSCPGSSPTYNWIWCNMQGCFLFLLKRPKRSWRESGKSALR